jgi:hypothetical protein
MPYTPVHAPPRAHGRAWARWAVHAHMWACVWRVCECAWARGRVLLVRVRPRTQRLRAWAEGKGCRRELCGPCAVSPSTNRCHAHSGVRARQPPRPRWQRAEPMAAAASRARRRSGSGGGRRNQRRRPAQGRGSCYGYHRDAEWSTARDRLILRPQPFGVGRL